MNAFSVFVHLSSQYPWLHMFVLSAVLSVHYLENNTEYGPLNKTEGEVRMAVQKSYANKGS